MSKSIHQPTTTQPVRQRRKILRRWLFVLIYAGIIFAASALPGDDLPSLGVSDKVLHAMEFGVLAFLLCRAFQAHLPHRSRYFIMVISILASIGYGLSDETHQWFVAGRTPDVADLVADSVGACLMAWAWVKAGTYWTWLQ